LAEALLSGKFGDGDLVEVRLDASSDRIVFGYGKPAEDGGMTAAMSDAAGDVAGTA
jgi:hypothetical protein